jgi:two-component system, LytTR family, sensor kinase
MAAGLWRSDAGANWDETTVDRDEWHYLSVGTIARRDGAPVDDAPDMRTALEAAAPIVDSEEMERSVPHIGALRILGVATALGIFSGLQAYNYVNLLTNREQPFHLLLALNVSYWYGWAILVPGILWLARRYRFGRHTWKRAAVVHAIGVVAATSAHAALATSSHVAILDLAGRPAEWWPMFKELFFLNFDWEMMTYWAVVGLSHALDFHRESQERELTAVQLEARLAEAQLAALQRQLHPHFLFNTLNTISALMHRDIEAADAMLERLSDLLRLTLDRISLQQVPLQDELDFIEKYLDIERARFGDRLKVHFDIAPDVLDAFVPTLLLQPLVENAVRHGIAPTVGGGRLEVSGRRDGDRLRLVVRDNGAGLGNDTLQAFNTGVGLSNTRSRLEHLYGVDHRFEFHRPPDGGLAVTVVIPFSAADFPGRSSMESVA